MLKKVLVTAVALAVSSGAAYAGDKNKFTKEEGVGMASGAVMGNQDTNRAQVVSALPIDANETAKARTRTTVSQWKTWAPTP